MKCVDSGQDFVGAMGGRSDQVRGLGLAPSVCWTHLTELSPLFSRGIVLFLAPSARSLGLVLCPGKEDDPRLLY